ncbi:RecX family transcriptional regulator [candidate division KSB1 bacterium]|nr:RecX family transcriptional regulator [candidate division KSB1 bacterium]
MENRRKITGIEPQKRNPHRRSIFLDGAFAFGLDEELVLKFALHEGDLLADEMISTLILTAEKKRAREQALHFLSYRARSEKEVREKLQKNGIDEDTIEWVLADLKQRQLIDDHQFALAFVHDRMTLHPSGPLALQQDLKRAGIGAEIIDLALEEAFRGQSPFQAALALAQKRMVLLKNVEPDKAKKRLIDFLMRRGFEWEIIREVLEQIQFDASAWPE